MVSGKNICPICRKKYSVKKESKMKIGKDHVCLKCYRKVKPRLEW